MIVVEGPDGSGKTTLCHQICNEFGLELGKRSVANRDEIYKTTREDTWKALYEELQCKEPPKVWDRMGPFSDPVYSAACIPEVRPCAFSQDEIAAFCEAMRWVGCVVLCLPPLAVVQENVAKGHQLPRVKEMTPLIWKTYRWRMARYAEYDYSKHDVSQVLRSVGAYLDRRKDREQCSSFSIAVTSE